jgi:hypothetical protein
MFASAGLLEGMDQDQQQRKRGFDEDLQTKVYMDAHNAQRQGKKGLGKSDKLKIAGTHVEQQQQQQILEHVTQRHAGHQLAGAA